MIAGAVAWRGPSWIGSCAHGRRIATWLVLAVCGCVACAQTRRDLDPSQPITSYIHQGWQVEQGLPEANIAALAQTPDGYLWIGTEEGVVRFDGVRFTIFTTRNSPGFPNDVVISLIVDREQNLWIGTMGA